MKESIIELCMGEYRKGRKKKNKSPNDDDDYDDEREEQVFITLQISQSQFS